MAEEEPCPACDGHGHVVERTCIRNRDGTRDYIRQRIKCRKCKGSGLK